MTHVYRQTLRTREFGHIVTELLHESIQEDTSSITIDEEGIRVDIDSHGDVVVVLTSPEPVEEPRLRDIGRLVDDTAHRILGPRKTVAVTRLVETRPDRAPALRS
jgi:hypothetical protein